MAQIVTITNPLTGQPAQVDQLEHTAQQIDDAIARALPSGAIDIALQNNDPRNWGLDLSKQLTDANDGTRNGFYTMTVGAANVPFDYGILLVHNTGNPNYVHQELTHYLEGIKACRAGAWDESTSAVKWNPWEWVNPPMALGVEYRTTGRYKNKPVYALRDNFGPNTNGAVMYYGNNVNDVVYGIAQDANGSTYPWYNGFGVNSWSAWFSFAKGADPSDSVSKVKVTCFAGSSASGSYAANTILVKYTKTTD